MLKAFALLGDRRSPCGERGLKYEGDLKLVIGIMSLPLRGAWIEIVMSGSVSFRASVAPPAGSVD